MGSNWIKNLQKRMFLKFCGHQINQWNIALCSTDFDDLCRIGICIPQTPHSQIGKGSAEIRIFFLFISSKKLKCDFLKSIQNAHFTRSFFSFYRTICLVFFWNMLIWMPITQFCGKLKIHFSDIGNLFLERITSSSLLLLLFFNRNVNIFWLRGTQRFVSQSK